jgi:glycosyltransferase involved in cell wall biosynthesis
MRRFVIVTPVLNGATFIGKMLDSVAAQAGCWVHYIVDGGSTDGTQDIARTGVDADPRRHLLEGKDKGIYDAVFRGFDQAKADGFDRPNDIYLWLNSDDLLMPWALATLEQAFDRTGADWITALPCLWDAEGRLVLVSPYAWHPRLLIRMGLFHGQGLGWIQQESSFFTRRLLDNISRDAIFLIREKKLAGDFLLWQEFARHTAPVAIANAVSGFRSHGANMSALQMPRYYTELREAGVRIVPSWLGRLLRIAFRPLALLQAGALVRRQARHLACL